MNDLNKKEKERTYRKNKETICWFCKHSVPKLAKDKYGDYITGKYVAGCEWSIYKQKVPFWEAESATMIIDNKKIQSFIVAKCPKFERG